MELTEYKEEIVWECLIHRTPPENGIGARKFRLPWDSHNKGLSPDPRFGSNSIGGYYVKTTPSGLGGGQRPLTLGEALQVQQREEQNFRAAGDAWAAEQERKRRPANTFSPLPSSALRQQPPSPNPEVIREVIIREGGVRESVVDEKINTTKTNLEGKVDATKKGLEGKIDNTKEELETRIRALERENEVLRNILKEMPGFKEAVDLQEKREQNRRERALSVVEDTIKNLEEKGGLSYITYIARIVTPYNPSLAESIMKKCFDTGNKISGEPQGIAKELIPFKQLSAESMMRKLEEKGDMDAALRIAEGLIAVNPTEVERILRVSEKYPDVRYLVSHIARKLIPQKIFAQYGFRGAM